MTKEKPEQRTGKEGTPALLTPHEILGLAKKVRTVEGASYGYIGAVDASQDLMIVVLATHSLYNPDINDRSRDKMVYYLECRAVPKKNDHGNIHGEFFWEGKILGEYPHFDSLDNITDPKGTEKVCRAVYVDLERKYVAGINEKARKELESRGRQNAGEREEQLGLARKLIG